MKKSKSYSTRLQEDLSKALEKVSSKVKYICEKLELLIRDYLSVRARLQEEQERYQQANARVMKIKQELAEMSHEAMKVKQEIKDRIDFVLTLLLHPTYFYITKSDLLNLE